MDSRKRNKNKLISEQVVSRQNLGGVGQGNSVFNSNPINIKAPDEFLRKVFNKIETEVEENKFLESVFYSGDMERDRFGGYGSKARSQYEDVENILPPRESYLESQRYAKPQEAIRTSLVSESRRRYWKAVEKVVKKQKYYSPGWEFRRKIDLFMGSDLAQRAELNFKESLRRSILEKSPFSSTTESSFFLPADENAWVRGARESGLESFIQGTEAKIKSLGRGGYGSYSRHSLELEQLELNRMKALGQAVISPLDNKTRRRFFEDLIRSERESQKISGEVIGKRFPQATKYLDLNLRRRAFGRKGELTLEEINRAMSRGVSDRDYLSRKFERLSRKKMAQQSLGGVDEKFLEEYEGVRSKLQQKESSLEVLGGIKSEIDRAKQLNIERSIKKLVKEGKISSVQGEQMKTFFGRVLGVEKYKDMDSRKLLESFKNSAYSDAVARAEKQGDPYEAYKKAVRADNLETARRFKSQGVSRKIINTAKKRSNIARAEAVKRGIYTWSSEKDQYVFQFENATEKAHKAAYGTVYNGSKSTRHVEKFFKEWYGVEYSEMHGFERGLGDLLAEKEMRSGFIKTHLGLTKFGMYLSDDEIVPGIFIKGGMGGRRVKFGTGSRVLDELSYILEQPGRQVKTVGTGMNVGYVSPHADLKMAEELFGRDFARSAQTEVTQEAYGTLFKHLGITKEQVDAAMKSSPAGRTDLNIVYESLLRDYGGADLKAQAELQIANHIESIKLKSARRALVQARKSSSIEEFETRLKKISGIRSSAIGVPINPRAGSSSIMGLYLSKGASRAEVRLAGGFTPIAKDFFSAEERASDIILESISSADVHRSERFSKWRQVASGKPVDAPGMGGLDDSRVDIRGTKYGLGADRQRIISSDGIDRVSVPMKVGSSGGVVGRIKMLKSDPSNISDVLSSGTMGKRGGLGKVFGRVVDIEMGKSGELTPILDLRYLDKLEKDVYEKAVGDSASKSIVVGGKNINRYGPLEKQARVALEMDYSEDPEAYINYYKDLAKRYEKIKGEKISEEVIESHIRKVRAFADRESKIASGEITRKSVKKYNEEARARRAAKAESADRMVEGEAELERRLKSPSQAERLRGEQEKFAEARSREIEKEIKREKNLNKEERVLDEQLKKANKADKNKLKIMAQREKEKLASTPENKPNFRTEEIREKGKLISEDRSKIEAEISKIVTNYPKSEKEVKASMDLIRGMRRAKKIGLITTGIFVANWMMSKRASVKSSAGETAEESADRSLYGGGVGVAPEGMTMGSEGGGSYLPTLSSARIQDPSSYRIRVNARGKFSSNIDYGLFASQFGQSVSDTLGINGANVNMRINDDSRSMSDFMVKRKIERTI